VPLGERTIQTGGDFGAGAVGNQRDALAALDTQARFDGVPGARQQLG
jgi:hypothetical protein